MKQKLVNIVEKFVEIIIVLMGELIKNVCLLFAFGFCIEGKHLEMWIAVICGYTYEIIYYKTALFPYISPIEKKFKGNSRNVRESYTKIEVGKPDNGCQGKCYSIGNNVVMVEKNGVIQILNR